MSFPRGFARDAYLQRASFSLTLCGFISSASSRSSSSSLLAGIPGLAKPLVFRRGLLHYPSTIASESKYGTNPYYQLTAFSYFDKLSGIWVLNAQYKNTSGQAIGELNGTPTVIQLSTTPRPTPAAMYRMMDRNPCVTINSNGERFVAWEQMAVDGLDPSNFYSAIRTSKSDRNGDFTKNPVRRSFAVRASTMSWEWQVNPSITGFPMSRLLPGIGADDDKGDIEMLVTEVKKYGVSGNSNTLVERLYGAGNWSNLTTEFKPSGGAVNSQRSFGPYNGKPSFALGNLSTNPSVIYIPLERIGAWKGTFDSVGRTRFFSGETRVIDTSFAQFIWGDVFVGDTSSGHALRQVKLYRGVDTSGYTSTSQIRDSIFRTEVFDWPVGADIRYFRGIFADSLTHATGGDFNRVGVRMKYIVELVHVAGGIDTIEEISFAPYYSQSIQRGTVRVAGPISTSEDVYLRVRGEVSSIPEADSLYLFEDISKLDSSFVSYLDTTLVPYKLPGNGSEVVGGQLKIMPAFPNPVPVSARGTSVLVYAPKSVVFTVSLVDLLGRTLGEPMELVSVGGWQRVWLPIQRQFGVLVCTVQAGGDKVSTRIMMTR